jgi:hypothetical protein
MMKMAAKARISRKYATHFRGITGGDTRKQIPTPMTTETQVSYSAMTLPYHTNCSLASRVNARNSGVIVYKDDRM